MNEMIYQWQLWDDSFAQASQLSQSIITTVESKLPTFSIQDVAHWK